MIRPGDHRLGDLGQRAAGNRSVLAWFGAVGGVAMAGPPDTACSQELSGGIDGNDNPWTVGIGSWSSMEGGLDSLNAPLVGGAVDELRISAVRRDFSTLATP